MATPERKPTRTSTARSTQKTSTEKKPSPRRSSAERSSKGESTSSRPTKKRPSSGSSGAPWAEAGRKPGAVRVAALAAQQLLELTGKESEGVTGLERDDDGWRVQVEVVEVRRIPNTTDVLALYEVATDEQGELQSYRRLRRYTRGTPGDE